MKDIKPTLVLKTKNCWFLCKNCHWIFTKNFVLLLKAVEPLLKYKFHLKNNTKAY